MDGILYSLYRRIINYIKNNYKVMIFVFILFLIFMSSMFLSTGINSHGLKSPIQEINSSLEKEGIYLSLSLENILIVYNILTVLISMVLLLIHVSSVGVFNITKPEATYYFTIPVKHQKVLLYFSFKTYVQVFFSLFGFAYINLMMIVPLFNLNLNSIILLFLSQLLILILFNSVSFFLLCLKFKNKTLYSVIKNIIIYGTYLFFIFVIYVFFTSYIKTPDHTFIFESIKKIFDSKFLIYYPFTGLPLAFNKLIILNQSILPIFLTILLIIIFLFVSYNMNIDLTSSAFDMAEKFEKQKKSSKQTNLPDFINKSYSDKSLDIKFSGIKSLFSKYAIEYKRSSFFFINTKTLFYISMYLFFIIIFHLSNASSSAEESAIIKLVSFFVSVYVYTLFSSKSTNDFSNPTFRLLPFDDLKKFGISILCINFENIPGAIITFFLSLAINNNFLTSIVFSFLFLIINMLFIFVNMFWSIIFKEGFLSGLKVMFYIFTNVFIWLIGLFISIFIGSFSFYYVYIGIILYCIFVSFIFLILIKMLLSKGVA